MKPAEVAIPVWETWHFQIGKDDDFEFDREDGLQRRIGIFSTEQLACDAVDRLKSRPGFVDWPDGFRVFRSLLNDDAWSTGFVTSGEVALLPGSDEPIGAE